MRRFELLWVPVESFEEGDALAKLRREEGLMAVAARVRPVRATYRGEDSRAVLAAWDEDMERVYPRIPLLLEIRDVPEWR